MLRRYAAFFSLFRSVIDIAIIGSTWTAVYYLRFYSHLFLTTNWVSSIEDHLLLMMPVVCICYLACLWSGLYKSKRIQNLFEQFSDIIKASVLSGLLVLAFFYYVNDHPYSRRLLVLFVGLLFVGLSFSHLLTMIFLRFWRKRGYNMRHYAVIGAGEKGQTLVKDIEQMNGLVVRFIFFVVNDLEVVGSELLCVCIVDLTEMSSVLVRET